MKMKASTVENLTDWAFWYFIRRYVFKQPVISNMYTNLFAKSEHYQGETFFAEFKCRIGFAALPEPICKQLQRQPPFLSLEVFFLYMLGKMLWLYFSTMQWGIEYEDNSNAMQQTWHSLIILDLGCLPSSLFCHVAKDLLSFIPHLNQCAASLTRCELWPVCLCCLLLCARMLCVRVGW